METLTRRAPMRPTFAIAALSAACLLAAPRARALPVAGAYPSRLNALPAPNDDEKRLLDLLNADRRKRGLPAMKWEPLLSAVAREHSADMADHGYVNHVSPRLGTMEYQLHRAGASAPNSRFAVFRIGSVEDVAEKLRGDDPAFHLKPATQAGVGVVARGFFPKTLHVTLIAGEKHSTIEPFPTQPIHDKGYWLKGILAEGFANPSLIVTLPNGRVVEESLDLTPDRRFERIVYFTSGRGLYMVEIVAAGPMGPAVLELMRCYAGVPYPGPDAGDPARAMPADLRAAEREMLGLVNAARRQARLGDLAFDDALAAVARAHSRDMADNDFFAHVSPTTGALADRLKRAGIAAKKFAENLSSNATIRAAHEGLMNSPGHRMNILDPDVTRAGVGIVRGKDGGLVITQVFAQEFPAYDVNALAGEFIRRVNAERGKRGLPALKADPDLRAVAEENSRAMARAGRHEHERARELLAEKRLRYAVQIAVFQSSDPIGLDQTQTALEKDYASVGVGIVQTASSGGEKTLWTTILLGHR